MRERNFKDSAIDDIFIVSIFLYPIFCLWQLVDIVNLYNRHCPFPPAKIWSKSEHFNNLVQYRFFTKISNFVKYINLKTEIF